MRTTGQRSLTQQRLVAELKKRGHQDVTIRRLTDWRQKDLLPPFDSIGTGRGRGSGRKPSSWDDPQQIIDRAEWVLKLLEMFRTSEEVYLPLAMLGYSVPLYRVHRALREPLTASVNTIQAEVQAEAETHGDCNVEDAIGEAAYHYSQIELDSVKQLAPSQDILEAIMNIFLNPAYDLKDTPFTDAVSALEDWNQDLLATKFKRLSDFQKEGEVKASGRTVDNFLASAPFFQRYLSLHQLKRAVDEATENDLEAMLGDVRLLREIALIFGRMVSILSRDLPKAFKTSKAEIIPVLFGGGRLVMWADLSLRRNGFADLLDESLPKLLEELRNEFDSKLEQECAAASPMFGLTVAALAADIKDNLKNISNAGTNLSPP
jgi:hypothetical protein